MQRQLAAAILLVVLCSHVGLCRRSSSASRRNKNTSTGGSDTNTSSGTSPRKEGNLCYGGPMIEGMVLEPQDSSFYKENWKDFPTGLLYARCLWSLQPNETKESRVGGCVTFTVSSSKLDLPEGRHSSDQKARVMWHVINYLCAQESCSLPCSSTGGLAYWGELLIISLISCSVLAAG